MPFNMLVRKGAPRFLIFATIDQYGFSPKNILIAMVSATHMFNTILF